MAHAFFQFKEFTVYQDRCAMKVCTDACLFGAWVADFFQKDNYKIQNVLDVGTGTGLLSLMLAQQFSTSHFNAVELDKEAAKQAEENVATSPWKDRISIRQSRIQDFETEKKYDLIVCNPPFYEKSLTGNGTQKNMAHHSTELSLAELIQMAGEQLSDTGFFALLLPYYRTNECTKLALQNGLSLQKKTEVKPTEHNDYFRSMILFSQCTTGTFEKEEIVIKDSSNQYTETFQRLLKPYYLYL